MNIVAQSTPINLETYPRRTHFEAYSTTAKCVINLTQNVDITQFLSRVKAAQLRFYPAFIALMTHVVNNIDAFKLNINHKKELGIWNFVSPSYTIFHEDDKTFSALTTEFDPNLQRLYQAIIQDIEHYENVHGLAVGPQKPNVFHVSCLPWLNFEAFSLELYSDLYLGAIITIGRYRRNESDKIMLPVSICIHHAAADGYHIGCFFEQLQNSCNNTLL